MSILNDKKIVTAIMLVALSSTAAHAEVISLSGSVTTVSGGFLIMAPVGSALTGELDIASPGAGGIALAGDINGIELIYGDPQVTVFCSDFGTGDCPVDLPEEFVITSVDAGTMIEFAGAPAVPTSGTLYFTTFAQTFGLEQSWVFDFGSGTFTIDSGAFGGFGGEFTYSPSSADGALTVTGFYWPSGSSSLTTSPGFMAESCNGDTNYVPSSYHLGHDFDLALGDPVYAIADGTVQQVSYGSWGAGNVALIIRHRMSNNLAFQALYGHITSTLTAGSTVTAGEEIGSVGPYSLGDHLHFGIHPGPVFNADAFGRLGCARWPDSNGFVEPVHFINTQAPLNSD